MTVFIISRFYFNESYSGVGSSTAYAYTPE